MPKAIPRRKARSEMPALGSNDGRAVGGEEEEGESEEEHEANDGRGLFVLMSASVSVSSSPSSLACPV